MTKKDASIERMRHVLSFIIFASSICFTSSSLASDMNKLILDIVEEMPSGGGYELTTRPAERMMEAFSWTPTELTLEPKLAIPSYCTTATYMIFYLALEKFWNENSISPSAEILRKLKPELEKDGDRLWGRWNSNGPGTAKLFFDTRIGTNFDDIEKALPGDFIKIFWNNEVGKLERGHTGVFLGIEKVNGIKMLHFWASSKSTDGFSKKMVPLEDVKHILFSRLSSPQNFMELSRLSETDEFLASMLTRVSSWSELRRVSGF